jgi:predicted transcriptional regulator
VSDTIADFIKKAARIGVARAQIDDLERRIADLRLVVDGMERGLKAELAERAVKVVSRSPFPERERSRAIAKQRKKARAKAPKRVSVPPATVDKATEKVLGALKKGDQPISLTEIRERTGGDYYAIRKGVQALVTQRKVTRETRKKGSRSFDVYAAI